MKYYLYVSDTKVDMLYSQIPVKLRNKVATELKIDLKIFSTTISEAPSEVTRYSKLAVVTDYIEKHEPVGTVDKPASYIKSTMPLRWVIGDSDTFRISGITGVIGELVFFAGETSETILVMGGSRKHIIGEAPSVQKNVYVTSASLRMVIELMMQDLYPDKARKRKMQNPGYFGYDLARLSETIGGPTQSMEFIAKRVLDEKDELQSMKTVLLVSPIYVAYAE